MHDFFTCLTGVEVHYCQSVMNEIHVLYIAGFEITIEHPHTDVVKCSQLVRGIDFIRSLRHLKFLLDIKHC